MNISFIFLRFLLALHVVLFLQERNEIASTNDLTPTPKKDITFLSYCSEGDLIHFYFNDILNNNRSFAFQADTDTLFRAQIPVHDYEVKEIKINENNETIRYLFFEGDSVEIRYLGRNKYQLVTDDPVRQQELDFQYAEFSYINAGNAFNREDTYQKNFAYLTKELKKSQNILEDAHNEKKVSSRFYDYMNAFLLSAHIVAVVYPINVPDGIGKITDVDTSYIRSVVPLDDKYLSMFTYRNAVWQYLRILTVSTYQELTENTLFEVCVKEFDGKIRDFLLARIVNESITHNRAQDYNKKRFLHFIQDSIYHDYVLSNIHTKKVEEDVIYTLDHHNDFLNLAEIITEAKDSLIYVDFWASWCVPCKMEMKYYPDLLEKYKSKKVKFLFLSVDTDVNAWRNSVKEFDFMGINSSFLLARNFDSRIAKDINLRPIPRYILIAKGEVIAQHALRPSDKEIMNFIDHHL